MRKILLILLTLVLANIAFAQSVVVKDSDNHTLIQINDEGNNGGSITLPDATSVEPTTNKLYNISNSLYWNGSALGTVGGADGDWTISGDDIYSTVSGNVGIGTATPGFKLDVVGKIGIDGTQILYLPNQTTFEGTIVIGNGGANLSDLGGSYDGQHNIAIGIGTLEDNTTGYDNIFIGHIAGQKNTEGHENTCIGWGSGRNIITGNHNTFYGNAAGGEITGSDNIFVGCWTGDNASGSQNIFIGNTTGRNNEIGANNTFIGHDSGIDNHGYNSTFIGSESGHSNIGGGSNTYIGMRSGMANVGGSNNTYLGTSAGEESTGGGNVFIGCEAGKNELGDHKLYIENSDSPTPLIGGDFNTDDVIINGDLEVTGTISGVSDDGDWLISGDNMYSTVSGNVGIGTSSPLSKLSVGGDGESNWIIYSETTETDGIAVTGFAANDGTGVFGYASGSNAYGVIGWASNTGVVTNYGGYFDAKGSMGRGVYGKATNIGDVTNYGGYFEANGWNGRGVYGKAGYAGSAANYGGYFQAAGSAGRGVYSEVTHVSGTNYGILSKTNSPNGWAGYFEGRGYFSGNVGIGTNTPNEGLHVLSSQSIQGTFQATSTYPAGIKLIPYSGENWEIMAALTTEPTSPNSFSIYNRDDEAYRLVIADNGNVGIGTRTPSELLEITGKVRANTGFNMNGTDGVNGTYSFYNDGTTSGQVQSITVSGGIITAVSTIP